MATVYVTYGMVGPRGLNGTVDVFKAGTTRSETITSSGASASGAIVARKGEIAQIYCLTHVYATSAAAPVATLVNGQYNPPALLNWVGMQEGDKLAVIDAV